MELPNTNWDHDYNGIHYEQVKCGGRLGIPELLGLKWFEVRLPSISELNFKAVFSRNTCLHHGSINRSKHFFMETRSSVSENRSSSKLIGRSESLLLRLFSLLGKVLSKVRKERCCIMVIKPAWQSQAWYTSS